MTGHRFGRDARLSGRKEFARVVTKGRKTVGRQLLLWTLRRGDASGPRFGTSVSRKVGGAVLRNRVKRLLREAFRLNRHRVKAGYDLVVYPRPGCRWSGLNDVEDLLLGVCRKGGILQDIR